MVSNCPNCGAHLNIVLTGRLTATPAVDHFAAPQRREQPTEGGSPELDTSESEADLQRIKELMCTPLKASRRPEQPTMRRVVSEGDELGALKDSRARETMDRVAKKMQATIHAAGERSANSLIESRQRGRSYSRSAEHVFEALGAIIYAMEWTGDDPGAEEALPMAVRESTGVPTWDLSIKAALTYIFELMLVIDYGFPPYPIRGPKALPKCWYHSLWTESESFSTFLVATAWRWRQQQALPDSKGWHHIAKAAAGWVVSGLRMPVWDVATMLYYYHAHQRPVDAKDHKQGWTGYTGVLQEMIAEVPTRGKDRLERKLSLDVHIIIPRYVRDRQLQAQMLKIAQDLADQHGCQLAAPPVIPKQPRRRRWFGLGLIGRGFDDGEKVDETDEQDEQDEKDEIDGQSTRS